MSGAQTMTAKAKETAPKKTALSREKTTLIGGHFPQDVRKQLRIIAAKEGTTNQALLVEALNLLFRKKGKPTLAH